MKLLCLVLCAGLVSCIPGDDPPPPTTPQITTGTADPVLRDILLSVDDVDAAYGDPGVFEEVPVSDASLYDNPDPRGVCGAKIEQPDFEDAAIATFQSTSGPGMLIVSAVWDLPPGEAAAFVEKHRKDSDPGCSPFTSKTPFHATQRVHFLGEIALPPIGDLRIGGSLRIQVKGQPQAYASSINVSDGSKLVFTLIFGASEASERFVRGLAEATDEELASD